MSMVEAEWMRERIAKWHEEQIKAALAAQQRVYEEIENEMLEAGGDSGSSFLMRHSQGLVKDVNLHKALAKTIREIPLPTAADLLKYELEKMKEKL